MARSPDVYPLTLIHDALNSLSVARAYVNLEQRRIRQRDPFESRTDWPMMEGFANIQQSMLKAVSRLREIEGYLQRDRNT